MPQPRVILLHPDSPPKPAAGRPCNGCGICCAVEPCPLGVWITRRRRGACAALAWDAASRRHVCAGATEPRRHLRWLPAAWGRWLALRWIAAARGCDADLETG
jgi:hypothetical protein